MPRFVWGALGFSRRGQHNAGVKERGGQVTWLKPQSSFWRPVELPELGFTPETRPDAALQRDTGALDDGWDWEATSLLRDGEVALWPCHKIPMFSSWTEWAQAQEV